MKFFVIIVIIIATICWLSGIYVIVFLREINGWWLLAGFLGTWFYLLFLSALTGPYSDGKLQQRLVDRETPPLNNNCKYNEEGITNPEEDYRYWA